MLDDLDEDAPVSYTHLDVYKRQVLGDTVQLELCLPAAQELNLNPSLLTGFLEEKFGLPAASAGILRTKFLTEDKQMCIRDSSRPELPCRCRRW